MTKQTIRIATRRSSLALIQANYVRDQLLKIWPDLSVDLLPMVTSGDKPSSFLSDKSVSIKGLFVKELQEALLDGRADIAVHSMKDVPATFPDGLGIMAILKRENPFDAFVSPKAPALAQLPHGATVGTSSLRRQFQVLAQRPDININPIRGNIHTRLSKLDQGECDALILAASGLQRADLADRITETLSDTILPACGQGALGVECVLDREDLQTLLKPLHNQTSALCVQSERRVSERLDGGCHTPLAVYATLDNNNHLTLTGRVGSPDGTQIITHETTGPANEASELADACAEHLLANGGRELMASLAHD